MLQRALASTPGVFLALPLLSVLVGWLIVDGCSKQPYEDFVATDDRLWNDTWVQLDAIYTESDSVTTSDEHYELAAREMDVVWRMRDSMGELGGHSALNRDEVRSYWEAAVDYWDLFSKKYSAPYLAMDEQEWADVLDRASDRYLIERRYMVSALGMESGVEGSRGPAPRGLLLGGQSLLAVGSCGSLPTFEASGETDREQLVRSVSVAYVCPPADEELSGSGVFSGAVVVWYPCY